MSIKLISQKQTSYIDFLNRKCFEKHGGSDVPINTQGMTSFDASKLIESLLKSIEKPVVAETLENSREWVGIQAIFNRGYSKERALENIEAQKNNPFDSNNNALDAAFEHFYLGY